jgi:hypothetical protein
VGEAAEASIGPLAYGREAIKVGSYEATDVEPVVASDALVQLAQLRLVQPAEWLRTDRTPMHARERRDHRGVLAAQVEAQRLSSAAGRNFSLRPGEYVRAQAHRSAEPFCSVAVDFRCVLFPIEGRAVDLERDLAL